MHCAFQLIPLSTTPLRSIFSSVHRCGRGGGVIFDAIFSFFSVPLSFFPLPWVEADCAGLSFAVNSLPNLYRENGTVSSCKNLWTVPFINNFKVRCNDSWRYGSATRAVVCVLKREKIYLTVKPGEIGYILSNSIFPPSSAWDMVSDPFEIDRIHSF